jgi:Putative Flp pilus-assembly TadE/G-like
MCNKNFSRSSPMIRLGNRTNSQHCRRRCGSTHSPENRTERGAIAVATSIILVVLLLFVALAIDIATLNSRAASLQRTADAAVLAGASGLPNLADARARAVDAVSKNASSENVTVDVSDVPDRPGRLKVTVKQKSKGVFSGAVGASDYNITKTAYADRTVPISMGAPYNSIGTGDLPGTVPGDPAAIQGYFLAVNGPCTAKEDGDRFLALYDGTRGSLAGGAGKNSDAYHCAEDSRSDFLWSKGTDAHFTGTPQTQWKRNIDSRPGGYSFLVNVPCDGGVTPCLPGTPITDGVYVDAWDPWMLAWTGEPPCPPAERSTGSGASCVVDKVPIANVDKNWVRYSMGLNFSRTKFAIYGKDITGSFSATPLFPLEDFPSQDSKWTAEHAGPTVKFPCAWEQGKWMNDRRSGEPFQANCKDWFSLHNNAIKQSGQYRVQVTTDPAIHATVIKDNLQVDGSRSFGINSFSLRVRRASQLPSAWTPCSAGTSPECASISGEGALSVYVRTPGSSDLFLSQLSPASAYRGRTVQIQLWDPGEGAQRIKILQPVPVAVDPSGWKSIDFVWSTGDPGLTSFDPSATVVTDRAAGWTGSDRTGVIASAADGIDVSGTYGDNAPPWPITERYSQAKFNGRMLLIDVQIPNDYGKASDGTDLVEPDYQGGWWKIRYESGSGVEDRTTWVVNAKGGPIRLARPET